MYFLICYSNNGASLSNLRIWKGREVACVKVWGSTSLHTSIIHMSSIPRPPSAINYSKRCSAANQLSSGHPLSPPGTLLLIRVGIIAIGERITITGSVLPATTTTAAPATVIVKLKIGVGAEATLSASALGISFALSGVVPPRMTGLGAQRSVHVGR